MNLDAGRCVIEWTCDLTPERINKPSVTKGLGVHMTSLSWMMEQHVWTREAALIWMNAQTLIFILSRSRRSQCCEWERLCTVDCEGLKSPSAHVENSHFVLASLGCRLISETQPSWRSSPQILAAGYNISRQHKYFLLPKYHVYWNRERNVIPFPAEKDEIGWLRRGSAYTLHKCTTNVTVLCLRCIIISKGGGGSFLYIYSATQREGDVARVTTRSPFPASIGQCHLRFWFYMHGSDRMGTLKVIKTRATSP